MTRVIAHLSDLHFGRVDRNTLDPLVSAIDDLRPDVIAVSGDLTQRARREEFREARAFLDRLPGPRVVVPGNHDVPLHNPYSRFVSKWARFREYIHAETEQSYSDDAMVVIGINTARALTWKGGRISFGQMESVRQCFCSATSGALKVLVVHHPIDVPWDWSKANQVLRARRALAQWSDCGVDLILAGHAHQAFAGGASEALRIGSHRAVIVQAGTATSTRGRGEPNSFNVIRVTARAIEVMRQTWNHEQHRFVQTHEDEFSR
ncbi:MAG TPA: metallophosphoesterase family protein [Bryobacteraceae bacterium]|nr:metallophosphoesterase family protein [Bryobacteraceae bacterium]